MPPKSSSYQISATPATMFAHLLVVAVATLVLVWLLHFRGGISLSDIPIQTLNVHTLLMGIGFLLFSGEAILAYKYIPAKRRVQKAFHSILHLVALVAGVVGVYAAFKYKDDIGYKHLTSLHGWLGMIAICLFGLQYLLGFFSFIFPRSQMSSRASYVPWHVFGGMMIFFLAICTAEMGFLQRSNTYGLGVGQEGLIVNFTGLSLFLFGVSVGLGAVLPRRSRLIV